MIISLGNRADFIFFYLFPDGTIDSHNREGEDDTDMSTAPLANHIVGYFSIAPSSNRS